MRELHVVALSEDGKHVVLATSPDAVSGEFRVALDQRLTAAVRGELLPAGGETTPTISPREIQARLRDGESPEQIATAAGVPLSRVERFAGPVLAELDRVLDGARAATVHRPRLGPSEVPLGEAVELSLAGVNGFVPDSVRWSARREGAGRWVVQLSWSARGRRRTAGWRYDPSRAELTPVDSASATLGHVENAATARAAAAAVAADAAAGTGRRRQTVRPAPAASPRKARQEQPRAATGRKPAGAATAAAAVRATPAATTTAQRAPGGPARSSDAPAASTARAATRRPTGAPARATPTPTPKPNPNPTPTRRPAPRPATTGTAPAPRRRAAVPPVDPEPDGRESRRAGRRRAETADVATPADGRDHRIGGRGTPAPEPVPARPPLLRVVPADPEPDRTPAEEGRPREGGPRDEPPRDEPPRDQRARDDERPAAGRARATAQRAPDWADVLLGAAPGPPREKRPGE